MSPGLDVDQALRFFRHIHAVAHNLPQRCEQTTEVQQDVSPIFRAVTASEATTLSLLSARCLTCLVGCPG